MGVSLQARGGLPGDSLAGLRAAVLASLRGPGWCLSGSLREPALLAVPIYHPELRWRALGPILGSVLAPRGTWTHPRCMALDDFTSISIGKRMILGGRCRARRSPNIIRFPMKIDMKSSRAMPRAMPIPGPPLGQAPGPLQKRSWMGPGPPGGQKRS